LEKVEEENRSENESSFLEVTDILHFNIAGLKAKVADIDFLRFIKRFDVIFLIETFVLEEDFSYCEGFLKDFDLKWISALQTSQFGRPSGGLLLGINKLSKNYKIFSLNKINGYEVVCARLGEREEACLLPVYLNCNKWNEDFDSLINFMYQNAEREFILIGDMNVRIGTEQIIYDKCLIDFDSSVSQTRNSKDKVINVRGRRFLEMCDDFDLIVLNGRSKGDREGELTFVGSMGVSVNDIAAVSGKVLKHVNDFLVIPHFISDHMPIHLKLKIKYQREITEYRALPYKLIWSKEDEKVYKGTILTKLQSLDLSGDMQRAITDITDCIRKSTKQPTVRCNGRDNFKQQWFDNDCRKGRDKMFSLLNLFRKTNSTSVKNMFIDEKKRYKKLCTDKKRDYRARIYDDLAAVKDTKSFWSCMKKLRGIKYKILNTVKVSDWVPHFFSLLNPPLQSNTIVYAEPYIQNDVLDRRFDREELKLVLLKAKNNKAAGEDGVPYEYYKKAPDQLLDKIIDIFNKIFISAEIPDSFKFSVIFPLYKKGDVDLASNYRGISFINAICKLFTGLLLNRLQHWVDENKILKECQAGFRKGYSTVDNLFTLVSLAKLKMSNKRGKLYCFFVDFSAAFDTIDRRSLFYKLSGMGLSSRFLDVLKSLYDGTRAGVWLDGGMSESFATSMGVRQGCLLSPLLFSLFLNDLENCLGGGVRVGDLRVRLLMYADDIALLAESPQELQSMINCLENYCSMWNLKVNLGKSKIIIFRNGGRPARKEKWKFNNTEIEVVKKYKYLGVTLTPTLNFVPHLEDKLKCAKAGLSSGWKHVVGDKKVLMSSKWVLFNTVARSIIGYAAQVWGYKKFEEVEKLKRYFIKRLFDLPYNTPNYLLFIETGESSLFEFTFMLHSNYIIKVMSMNDNRLPKRLALEVIKRKIFWFKSWLDLTQKLTAPVNFNLLNTANWRVEVNKLLEVLKMKNIEDMKAAACTASFHHIYKRLRFDLSENSYIKDEYNISNVKWLMKVRGELINLNYKPWIPGRVMECSLCNSHEKEDTYHFVARCSVLCEWRCKWLGNSVLSEDQFYEYLNGKDWVRLASFCREAWNFRWFMIQNFNY
jgi:hypothetical protein